MKLFACFCFALLFSATLSVNILPEEGTGNFQAGVAKIDGTLPQGVPLSGYNHGARRVPFWPIPDFGPYTTWMTGNVGALNPSWVKALVIDNGQERFCFVTMDAIGADGNIGELAFIEVVV